MLAELNDFILFQSGKKKIYGFIKELEAPRKNGEAAFLVKDALDENNYFEVKGIEIISNYGQEPDFEDLKIDIYYQEYIVPVFGVVTEYCQILEQERKVIKDTFESIKDIAKLYDIYPTRVNIKYNKGKMVGSYKEDKKDETGIISLMPKEYDKENLSQIIFHEMGHAIWNKNLSSKFKSKWVKLYDKNMERTEIESTEIENLREDLINSGMQIKDYLKMLEEPFSSSLKKVLSYIKDLYNLKISHLDTLIQNGDDLLKYWPIEKVKLSEKNPFVSVYATESVEEFFAESFMFYNLKQDLPESVRKAIEITLQSIGIDTSKI